ncbi:BTB/POZ and MATH domain-containing protein 2-like [Setaria italica]|uniref:BTB/POZ and MATH domain-containing protein 2-like n=1 Tax=Setaria italica TaxID=4555 RepID=UPI000350DA1F|nr:BTB/POZ and MATH domain-containing protein 2-like [Setaria italica]
MEPEFEVKVPPSDLLDNLGKLIEGKKGADATFKVRDELFPAHKIVLAMRSPVFEAEFYGPVAKDMKQYFTIEDMQPDVFRAVLCFIYTDSMPSLEEFDASDIKEMVRHLLVAADRYAMERLKLICEDILCKSVSVEDVATSQALADMHHCHNLMKMFSSQRSQGSVLPSNLQHQAEHSPHRNIEKSAVQKSE